MKQLDRLTLVCIDTKNYGQALHSLCQSLRQIRPARTIFFTDIDVYPQHGIEIVKINPIRSKKEYSEWILKELWHYIETDFVLVTQWDGYVLNGDAWLDEFYEYDYIGAPWIFEHGRQIGNGGFSIRSKHLLTCMGSDRFIDVTHPEDQSIGIVYRTYLEKTYGIKFPDEDLADKFAFELKAPVYDTFGFHGHFHKPYQPTVVIQRKAALGDIVALEPLLYHFYKKGYRVVLDTLPQFFNLFIQHYFKIHHPQEIDQRLLKNARVINLDMAYENTPKQIHLKSYYEMSGILDGEIRNPKLTLEFDHRHPNAKLFKKYVVIHNDIRPQKGRNIYGVNWTEITMHLHIKGYDVIQIGQGEHDKIMGATHMQNMHEFMLMRVIGGADFMIAIDSGPANIAVAMNVPLIVFAGAVDMEYIYPDLSNVIVIEKENVCRSPKCWHSVVSTEGIECVELSNGVIKTTTKLYQGQECVEPEPIPPCVNFSTDEVMQAINKMINNG